MLIQIIKHTPPWVFILFFTLLVMGYKQSKDRVVSQRKITILPTVMTGLSIYGVVSAFGVGQPLNWGAWLLGLLIARFLNAKLFSLQRIAYSEKELSFSIPGSWAPLFLMMIIFFIKYSVGVISARQLPIFHEVFFKISICFSYGLMAGMFFFRTLTIWHSKRNASNLVMEK